MKKNAVFIAIVCAILLVAGLVTFGIKATPDVNDRAGDHAQPQAAVTSQANSSRSSPLNSEISEYLTVQRAEGKPPLKSDRNITSANMRVQSDSSLVGAFATAAISNDQPENTAALSVQFFCTIHGRPRNMSFEDWYSRLPSIDSLGVPQPLQNKLENDRKRFAITLDQRCRGFVNGEIPKESIDAMRRQAASSPLAAEMGRTSNALRSNSVGTLLAQENRLFGSGDPAAYKLLTRAALGEIELQPTGNLQADLAMKQYLLASVLCATGEDCRQASILYAENCLNLGVCDGNSVSDALAVTLSKHGVQPRDNELTSAIVNWLEGRISWSDVLRITNRRK